MSEIKEIAQRPRKITRSSRCDLLGQKSKVFWFTGISKDNRDKNAIAGKVEEMLNERGFATYLLDDENTSALSQNLNSKADKLESIRGIGEVAKLFIAAGGIVLSAVTSPLMIERRIIHDMVGKEECA